MLSGLQLAYIGDSVHHLMIRTRLIRTPARVHELHDRATARINASAQAAALERIRESLTAEEDDIVRRGRNSHARHAAPRAAGAEDYASATGFEALLGYLYLTGRYSRLEELIDLTEEE